ncbi:MAG: LysM peptidoglycan-binding domain-containing protein [Opitutaceae bacterium]
MRFVRESPTAWVFLVMLLLLAGCRDRSGLEITSETDEPHYRRGIQMLRSGQNQVALEAFLKVIEKRNGDAPESHLEVGQIYLNHIQDPIAAIYHFRKYLELRPNSPQSPMVRELIDTSKKQFARQLPGQPLDDYYQHADLLDLVERLQLENKQMKAQLAAIQAEPLPSAEPPRTTTGPALRSGTTRAAEPVRAAPTTPTRAGGTRHVVARGDTLYSISKRYYGSGNRWREIYTANRSIMSSETDLKVGSELIIP